MERPSVLRLSCYVAVAEGVDQTCEPSEPPRNPRDVQASSRTSSALGGARILCFSTLRPPPRPPDTGVGPRLGQSQPSLGMLLTTGPGELQCDPTRRPRAPPRPSCQRVPTHCACCCQPPRGHSLDLGDLPGGFGGLHPPPLGE